MTISSKAELELSLSKPMFMKNEQVSVYLCNDPSDASKSSAKSTEEIRTLLWAVGCLEKSVFQRIQIIALEVEITYQTPGAAMYHYNRSTQQLIATNSF